MGFLSNADDIIFFTLMTYFTVWFINKYLDLKNEFPKKYKIFSKLWLGALFFVLLSGLLPVDLDSSEFLTILFLIISMLLLDSIVLDKVKNVYILLAPLVIMEFIGMISKILRDSPIKAIESFTEISVFWIFAFGIYLWRQKRKDDVVKKKEAEEKRLAEIKRNLLENLVAERTAELSKQKEALQISMDELQAAQAQLIQSEKMASLGELTAGIAHEIQNPLNFVNNFSELNNELIKELIDELSIGQENLSTNNVHAKEKLQTAIDIAKDLGANSEKINNHGHRASSIVKNMLEHSRKSSGEKTPTDINELCDEYLNLSYHGLRAKDPQDAVHNNFHSDYKLELDPNLSKINVVSQDIARVLLNLINNAFQACYEKSESLKTESRKEYKPLVIITTNYVASLRRCEISVNDNGHGIPDSIKDKIFQPFFTTKPTGQGTGLGLSLSYDIITKGHNGTLEVESKEGEGSKFIVKLPIGDNTGL